MGRLDERPVRTTTGGTGAALTSRGRRLLAAVLDDVRAARSQLLFSTIGGSAMVPGAGRRLLYALAGASVRSAPGTRFRFSGSPGNLTVGADVYMNQGVFIEAHAPVVIGDGCLMGMDSMIVTSNHPVDSTGRISHQGQGVPVSIGERVWIGARAVILPGSVVESDSIIAAGAVVRGHCAAHGLYAGVPARRIRELPRPVTA